MGVKELEKIASTVRTNTDLSSLSLTCKEKTNGLFTDVPIGSEWFLTLIQRTAHQYSKEIHLVFLVCISGLFLCLACHQNLTHLNYLPPSWKTGSMAHRRLQVAWENFSGISFAWDTLILFTVVNLNLSINLSVSQ